MQQSGDQPASVVSASTPVSSSSSNSSGSAQRGHTALTGLNPAAVRELLHRHNVTVLLTVRRNAVKEALSWHKARDLGVSQFNELRAARAAAAGGSGSGSRASSTGSNGQPPRKAEAQRLLRAANGNAAVQLAARADEAAPATNASPGGGGGSTSQVSGSRTGSPRAAAPAAVQVDIPRLLHWLNYTTRVNADLRAAVAYYGRPTLTVWYEDFLADPLGEARRAAAFIGVPPAAVAQLLPSAKFHKAGPDALHDAVANFGVRAGGFANHVSGS